MTEEIIIDGVNVAGCEFYDKTANTFTCLLDTVSGDNNCYICKDNLNCYYKQLQRAKQENERLKARLQEIKEIAEDALDEFDYSKALFDTCISILDKIAEVE